MIEKIESYKQFMNYINSGKPIIVKFTAKWCGPCKSIAPKYEQLSNVYKDIMFLEVDVDDNQDISAVCDISAMPTFQLFNNGSLVDYFQGANITRLENILKSI